MPTIVTDRNFRGAEAAPMFQPAEAAERRPPPLTRNDREANPVVLVAGNVVGRLNVGPPAVNPANAPHGAGDHQHRPPGRR